MWQGLVVKMFMSVLGAKKQVCVIILAFDCVFYLKINIFAE